MATKKVYIGVGHGGSDPGAVANGFEEDDVNLAVALACYNYLKARGVSVKISRTNDTAVWVEERVKQANSFGADLAVDIHHNAGGDDGAEVYHTKNGGTGKTLANNILTEIKAIGQNSRGAKTKLNSNSKDYFAFIRETIMPAVLCECAFLDNKTDLKIIDTAPEQKTWEKRLLEEFLKPSVLPIRQLLQQQQHQIMMFSIPCRLALSQTTQTHKSKKKNLKLQVSKLLLQLKRNKNIHPVE